MKLRVLSSICAVMCLLYVPDLRADDTVSDPVRAQVIDALSGYESVPSAAEWEKMGDVGPELFALSKDPTISPSVRVRATHALGYFPAADHQAWLGSLIADPTVSTQLRRASCYALANGWGDTALPLISPALTDSDKQLRNAAARAVGSIGSPAARATLEGRLVAEADPMVQNTLKSLLGR